MPQQPPLPTFVAELSSHTQIAIDISDFPVESAGGCTVSSFEIQKDDGNGGSFVSLAGHSNSTPYLMNSLVTTNVIKGRIFRFRYRAQNCHGWGPLSPILYSLAASRPEAPPAPTVVSISSTSVSLQLYPTHDNGGTIVIDYILSRNQGDGDSINLTEISSASYSYGTNGFLAVIPLSTESMTAGLFYQFSYSAQNKVGTSDASHVVTVPIADYPDAPTGLARVSSTRTAISLEWNKSSDTQLPAGLITGYLLYMDNGIHGDFDLVYNGEGVPTVRNFEATGLVTGRPYRFYVVTLNHVGQSPLGEIVTIYACENPSGLAAPEKLDVSKTSVTVKWT